MGSALSDVCLLRPWCIADFGQTELRKANLIRDITKGPRGLHAFHAVIGPAEADDADSV